MLTFEDLTGLFIKAACDLGLVAHPESWLNTRSLEREFTCTCHTGSCDDVEQQSSCVVSFSWGVLDTALSTDGPAGVCEFFHEVEQDCAHLHTSAIPPLVLDLSYTLVLHGVAPTEETLLSLAQMLKLQASEQSRRTIETRPGVSMILRDNRLYPEVLTLQQRVEIPIWHPLGMRGLHEEQPVPGESILLQVDDGELEQIVLPDDPQPEEWLPRVLVEVCQDIMQVLAALETAVCSNTSDRP
ncbi:hypothetical protein [Dictyobacter aurantiacus]|uniref:Uncharacterized protein n=1 Tax=Dictyobacter aurantiacus TaxID=1936993 RepID=A0A401ZB77_9CHLR|nr:hypothetical protein [Dictyobacter aurantiacus]GCE04134.1 hypothetical protein KDAU_14630 [Dictyobacter aurantiacus]